MTGGVKKLITSLRYEWRLVISSHPRFFSAWVGIRKPSYTLGVGRVNTDLVIEGYPRSGNTFAWYAFLMSQTYLFNIAHHSHIPAKVIQAVESGTPTLVLIRKPKDSVISHCIFQPNLPLSIGFRQWIRFYTAIKRYRYGYVIATFDEVITDFGEVMAKVNERFSTDFEIFEHTEQNVKQVFERIDQRAKIFAERNNFSDEVDNIVYKPSESRNIKKDELDMTIRSVPKLRSLLHQAQTLYDSYLEK